MGFQVLLLILATAVLIMDEINSQPIDNVDSCLFTCDYCFKGEVLLNCANECLASEDRGMSQMWKIVCPYFSRYHQASWKME